MRNPFPVKKYPGRILLRCESSGMAGSWRALTAILPTANGTEIWGTPDLDEYEPEEVSTIEGPFSERACVAFLANDDATACGGNFFRDAKVVGARGVWADLLRLAWMHDEEVGLNRIAVELLSLEDARLKQFWGSSGPFDSYFAERVAEVLRQLRDDGGVDETVTLAELLTRACPNGPEIDAFEEAVPRLIEEEESQEEARQEARALKLVPFEPAISRALARYSASKGENDIVRRRIRLYLEEQALSTGHLPSGTHDFGSIQTGYKSLTKIGRLDLDALLADA